MTLDRALDALRARPDRPLVLPDGVGAAEIGRTPAAALVGEHAAASGLFHFHFERRVHLPLPEAWVPDDQPDLAEPPEWVDGVLPEQKYQSFRHDLPIASYHPGHRAKWAVHELCHGLVGFAWRPDATPFFHATAGRLAELLPVALWYFFDEAFLRRCPVHQGGGSTFRVTCAACEAAAAPLVPDPDAERLVREGLRFVDKELAAVAASRRTGRLVPHRWATIDLCSDGEAYALAHGRRLTSDAMARLAPLLVPGGGWSPDLDALEARVVAVRDAVLGAPLAPLAPTPGQGRWRWILQDLAFRLLTVREECDGEAADTLDALVDRLADAIPLTTGAPRDVDDLVGDALAAVAATYEALTEDYELPAAGDVLALGYRWPGGQDGARQLEEGVASAMPLTRTLLGADLTPAVRAFAARDGFARRPLPARFADHLAQQGHAAADLARWEATVAGLPPRPPALSGPGEGWRLADGLVVLRTELDVLALAERVDAGGVELVDGDLIAVDGGEPPPGPGAVVIGREPDGGVLLVELDPAAADALLAWPDDPAPHLAPDEVAALADVGVLVPARLAERAAAGHDGSRSAADLSPTASPR